jgi:hypothetical protein
MLISQKQDTGELLICGDTVTRPHDGHGLATALGAEPGQEGGEAWQARGHSVRETWIRAGRLERNGGGWAGLVGNRHVAGRTPRRGVD